MEFLDKQFIKILDKDFELDGDMDKEISLFFEPNFTDLDSFDLFVIFVKRTVELWIYDNPEKNILLEKFVRDKEERKKIYDLVFDVAKQTLEYFRENQTANSIPGGLCPDSLKNYFFENIFLFKRIINFKDSQVVDEDLLAYDGLLDEKETAKDQTEEKVEEQIKRKIEEIKIKLDKTDNSDSERKSAYLDFFDVVNDFSVICPKIGIYMERWLYFKDLIGRVHSPGEIIDLTTPFGYKNIFCDYHYISVKIKKFLPDYFLSILKTSLEAVFEDIYKDQEKEKKESELALKRETERIIQELKKIKRELMEKQWFGDFDRDDEEMLELVNYYLIENKYEAVSGSVVSEKKLNIDYRRAVELRKQLSKKLKEMTGKDFTFEQILIYQKNRIKETKKDENVEFVKAKNKLQTDCISGGKVYNEILSQYDLGQFYGLFSNFLNAVNLEVNKFLSVNQESSEWLQFFVDNEDLRIKIYFRAMQKVLNIWRQTDLESFKKVQNCSKNKEFVYQLGDENFPVELLSRRRKLKGIKEKLETGDLDSKEVLDLFLQAIEEVDCFEEGKWQVDNKRKLILMFQLILKLVQTDDGQIVFNNSEDIYRNLFEEMHADEDVSKRKSVVSKESCKSILSQEYKRLTGLVAERQPEFAEINFFPQNIEVLKQIAGKKIKKVEERKRFVREVVPSIKLCLEGLSKTKVELVNFQAKRNLTSLEKNMLILIEFYSSPSMSMDDLSGIGLSLNGRPAVVARSELTKRLKAMYGENFVFPVRNNIMKYLRGNY